MATCPKCFTHYADETQTCPADGQALVPDTAIAAMDRDVPNGDMIGEYRVSGKLGEGGFGTVYRAVQPLIGKEVAIKVLSRKLSSDPEMVSRFVAEARAVNQIRSKHIVDIFGFGSLADGRQYYVMELLNGSTLEDYVRHAGFLEPQAAIPILRAIARALDAAHSTGIVHRDLKPENVFLVQEDEGHVVPKLLDFGIAKLMSGATGSHKTRTGVPIGTPYYMSPEQCRGDKVDQKTDVYSFGVVVFQVLTGKLPFGGESFMQVMFAHASAPPPKPSELRPGLSPEFDAPILLMLEKTPNSRPESCSLALEGIVLAAQRAGLAVDTLPHGTPGRVALPASSARKAEGFESARTAVAETGPTTLTAAERMATPRATGGKRALLYAAIAAAVVAVGAGAFLKFGSGHRRRLPEAVARPLPPVETAGSRSQEPPARSGVAPADTRVKLTIESEPKRVSVFLGDQLLGNVPDDEIRVEKSEQEIELTIRAQGFVPSKVKVKPAGDAVVSVKLLKRNAARRNPNSPLEY